MADEAEGEAEAMADQAEGEGEDEADQDEIEGESDTGEAEAAVKQPAVPRISPAEEAKRKRLQKKLRLSSTSSQDGVSPRSCPHIFSLIVAPHNALHYPWSFPLILSHLPTHTAMSI